VKIAYFDCFSGAAGDMILGALVDAGLDFSFLEAQIAKLHLSHYHLRKASVTKKGLGGTQIVVDVDQHHHDHHHRHLSDIEAIIEASDLDADVKDRSLAIFRRLAEAEAGVHRTSIEEVHFHEVGAVDTIVDIVGAVAGLSMLGIQQVHCSPLHVGSGTIECAHGILPVPAPATAELVKGKPVYSTGIEGELLTPTGAAILTSVATDFGPLPTMTVEKIGYGAGTSEPDIANLLRVFIGSSSEPASGYDMEQLAVIETSIDDMNPQIYDHLMQELLNAGAMDVFLAPLQMKKNRPGTLVTVICRPELIYPLCDRVMRETTTIGVRWRIDNRLKASREIERVHTAFGDIRVKISKSGSDVVNAMPEYDDCKKAALENQVSLKTVMAAALKAIP
jgi:uncharacterized protein (TIGR00299 family) protein